MTIALALTLVGCPEEPPPGEDAGMVDAGGGRDAGDRDAGGEVTVAQNPSRGASIAADESGTTLAVANKATDDVTFFNRADMTERARVSVGDEPVSVVFSPDGAFAYVVNRAGQSVSVISGADGSTPSVIATIPVGSEPGQLALSPTGATLYVSNWADGTLSVIDVQSGTVSSTVSLGGAPYAVCVTNNADENDSDETIYVTDFYSHPIAGAQDAQDRGRQARVWALNAGNPSGAPTEIMLQPKDVTGIAAVTETTAAFPNQLYGCAVNGDFLYVTAVGASPEPFGTTTDFHQNIHGMVYAINTSTNAVDDGRTVNLNELVELQTGMRRFAAVPESIAFVPGTEFGYIAVHTANMVLRVDFGQSPPVAGVEDANFLGTDPAPTGIAISGPNAYTYNEVGRSVSHIDLASQTTAAMSVASAPQPAAGSSEADALRGQRFFDTGLARWSTGAWVGCVGCHPMGTTDNVTWTFPAGPRQTVDTSATFNRDGSIQRILNWTAIFDEVHDFELNTRGVAGGVGAIVTDAALDPVNRINFVGPGPGNPTNGFNVGSVRGVNERDGVLSDWDEIEAYVRTIRSPRGATVTEGDPVAGRAVFESGGCANCHGGPLWTLSERYYTPVVDTDLRELTFEDVGITSLGSVRGSQTVIDEMGFGVATLIGNDANGPPQRHFCVVREVGTFGVAGPNGRGADEIRQSGTAAQGVDGFNVPSLLNIGTGAPYLHNGAADSLEELLDPDGLFGEHLRAGNSVFVPNETDLADLIAFLRTIDDDTPTIDVPTGQRLCPDNPTIPPRP